MLREDLAGGLSLALDDVVPTENCTLPAICHDLVLWSLHDGRVGLHGLLAAALGAVPTNPALLALQREWTGVTFTPPACPYPGMVPFTAEWGYFYGRDADSAEAVDCLRRHPFLAIIGPSGSGKSSLLDAGILPALEKSTYFAPTRWVVRSMRPGATPYTTLLSLLGLPYAASDGPPAALPAVAASTRLLLVVDQYEELYATAAVDQRKPFEQLLLRALAVPGVHVILCARADFYANLMTSPLWPAIRAHRMEITPLRGDDMRQAIALPARDVGVQLDQALVERLLADAGDEPGVLPFVQETLVMLWEHAGGFRIGLDAYTELVRNQSGRSGLQVALAKHADDVYTSVLVDEGEQALTRRVLLRLVQFGEGRADTRRQQTIDELRKGSNAGTTFDKVLAALTANRLLTLSNEARQVDLAHEALIQGWPALSAWIDERQAAEVKRRQLEEKAEERERLRQADGEAGLLDPVELAEAEAWIKGPDAAELGVSDELAMLVADSRQAIDAAMQEKERAAEQLRRRNAGLAIALVAALLAMAVAVVFFFNAQSEARNANEARQAAQAEAQNARAAEAVAQANADRAATQEAHAQANAVLADNAKATAQANLSLAQQQLDELQVEQLLTGARDKKVQLDAAGAIAAFEAAAAAAAARGSTLDVAGEISDTLRYVATQLVQLGENKLCEARNGPSSQCEALVTGQASKALTGSVPIDQTYVAWAIAVAPQLRGWSTYTATMQQQAVITASALFSQALALEPPADTPVYVWIGPGVFTMGSTDAQCENAGFGACPKNELPEHAVALDGYWMQRTAVTNEQYARCVKAEVCKVPANAYWNLPSSARLPVTDVSWTKAEAYASLVGGRLPTEAEWEYGCRGADRRLYPWGDEPAAADRLNYYNEYGRTIDVGTYPAGANGLYDMAGNVWQWTADWFSETYYEEAAQESPLRNPAGPAEETGNRTLRGGSWRNDGNLVRCAFRDNDPPGSKYYNVGLRVVAPGF